MVISNYYVGNKYNIIDIFIIELIKNNISYVLINNQNYVEIHFLDNIYRLYFNCYNNIDFENGDPFSGLFNKLSYNNANQWFSDSKKISFNHGKKRPGFKKYTKKMYKQDKNKYGKTNVKGY